MTLGDIARVLSIIYSYIFSNMFYLVYKLQYFSAIQN